LKLGVKTAGDLTGYGRERLREQIGDWAVALAEKAAGIDAGGWFDEAIGEDSGPKSVSHEHTFSVDVADREMLETTLAKLVEKVCRRLANTGCMPAAYSSNCAMPISALLPGRAPWNIPPRSMPSCCRLCVSSSGEIASQGR